MKRRPWLVSVCSMAVLAATAARARGQHVPRIALLPEFGGAAFRGYFAAAFREQGWEEGRDYVLEYGLTADFSLLKARVADHHGNLLYNKTARNFSPSSPTCVPATC